MKRDRFTKLSSGPYKGSKGIVKAYNLFCRNANFRVVIVHDPRVLFEREGAAFKIGVVVQY